MASTSETRLFNDLITTTLDNRKTSFTDQIFQDDVFLNQAKKYGAVEMEEGGAQIVRHLEYVKNTTPSSISEYGLVDLTPQQTLTAALFPWRQHAGSIILSVKEMLLNRGKNAAIKLVKQRVSNAISACRNDMSTMLNADGTGNSNLDFLGLQALVSAAPATGTVGGINRANESWWRNRANADLADNPATADDSISYEANGIAYLNEILKLAARGGGRKKPHLLKTTETIFGFHEALVLPHLRLQDNGLADLGFDNIKHKGIPMVHEEFSPKGMIHGINFDFLKIVFCTGAMFEVGKELEPTNQLAVVRKIHTMGNLVLDSARKQFCLAGIGA